MAHMHYCKVCKIPVANCSNDTCKTNEDHANAGEHFCSIHHPDPQFKVEPTPPLKKPPKR